MRVLLLALVAGLLTVAVNASAADIASGSISVVATFSSRTTLQVSADLLVFPVTTASAPVTASIDFVAAARTRAGAPVMLSVESVGGSEGPNTPDASLSFNGEGEGTNAGTVSTDSPTIAGQWIGSGVRRGRLVFALRANATGNYAVPLRFVLTAP
jgi:hypothetical protein